MKEVKIYDRLSDNPIIAAIKDESDLEELLDSDIEVKGLSDDEVGLRYLKENTSFSGIISTKWPQLVRAQALGFMTVYRIFMVDSLAFNSLKKAQNPKFPDFIEILPNASGKIIQSVKEQIKRPLIVSGLITDKEDVINALKYGAIAISSTNKNVWKF
jgi:glycerol uptake operon antiterminator